ncbi:uncharacterized protein PV06_02875 [Exophiala oligosperma]|uniref:Cyclase n=1 Tax=Exophiala oligosperma TaxID=215243 RepID=A0A0D2C3Q5_9EURO|nr:uncharacterized protein PV06_02875 [Exophiala oligosperma]KIW44402.1 hypothetical protein PV06_02875 [Exophiala oligosperma]
MLTPERTAAAAKLIETGEVVSMNWPINLPDPPVLGREPFKHTLKSVLGFGNDDIFEMNSQCSSQWDGLRHISINHNGVRTYYNNVTQHDVETSNRLGLQAWADTGIVGRGVLIDIWDFKNGSYDPHGHHNISVQDIMDCAKAQNVEFKYGDILIIRSGYIHKYNALDFDQRKSLSETGPWEFGNPGIEQTDEMLDFLHDNYFSILAGDSPGFEAMPQPAGKIFHQILIPLWGLSIGELFDLEKLSQTCKKYGRYEFFFSSSPPNIPGAAGCYPNALAIF